MNQLLSCRSAGLSLPNSCSSSSSSKKPKPAALFRESLTHHPLKKIFSTDLVIPLLFAAVLEGEEGDQSGGGRIVEV